MTKVGEGPMLAKLEPEIRARSGWTYDARGTEAGPSSRWATRSRSRAAATAR